MSCLLKKFLYEEEKISKEILKNMKKYNIDKVFIDKDFCQEYVKLLNSSLVNSSFKDIDNVVNSTSLLILSRYNKSDLISISYKLMKCVDNGYRAYFIANICNREELYKCISYFDDFFYYYGEAMTNPESMLYRYNFIVNEKEIKAVIDSIPMIIVLKDNEGKWILANKFAVKLYELDEDYLQKTDSEIAEKNDYVKQLISRRNSYDNDIWTSSSSYFYEESLMKNNNEMFYYVTKVPMNFQNGRKVLMVLKKDITGTKFTQNIMDKSGQMYKNIFEILPEAIFVHSNNNIIYSNKKAMQLIGCYDEKKIIGKSYKEFLEISPIYVKDIMRDEMGKLIYKGENTVIRSSIKRKADGKVFEMHIINVLLPYGNGETILSIICDLRGSEYRDETLSNTEASTEPYVYNELETQFMGRISHELRTPLNVILSALQVIELYGNCDEQEEKYKIYDKYYGVMKQNCYRLLRIVNNFMDVSEIEDGVAKLNFTSENIISIIEDVTLAAAEFISGKGRKNIVFDTDIEEKIMMVDKEKLERVVLNLLSNAIKFTGKGGNIKVNVYDKGDSIKIAIRDDGIGIPKDKQKIIFENFEQIDKSFARKNEGSGIGLAVVKSIVELHGGKISVNSNLGLGSEFVIDLPVINAEVTANKYVESVINLSSHEKVSLEFSDLLL